MLLDPLKANGNEDTVGMKWVRQGRSEGPRRIKHPLGFTYTFDKTDFGKFILQFDLPLASRDPWKIFLSTIPKYAAASAIKVRLLIW